MLNWKRKTSSLEKKFLNRSYCWLNASPQQQWRIQARNEATSWRNTKDDETNDGDVPKTSQNLVAQPWLVYFCYLYLYMFLLTYLCLWITASDQHLLLLNNVYTSELLLRYMTSDYRISHYVFLISFFFVFTLYLFVDDKRGSRCIVFKGSEPH